MILSFVAPSRKTVILLSCKYDIPEETTQQLLEDYVKTTSLITTLFTTKEEKPKVVFKEFIDKLCSQHNIPKDKIASILFDYELYESIQGFSLRE